MNRLPENMARIVGGHVHLRQIHKTFNCEVSDKSHAQALLIHQFRSEDCRGFEAAFASKPAPTR
ncbi:hypothetical protein GIW50_01475 [Pseudomonas syringae]|uniref:Uncharacterized protein n=1 Tax=Pseudomonas syringae TaxID=317 RepID=A0A9Q3WY82_PSESX|nr:hypothetical protein [Pseudomonas syringae]MCF5061380.1 hypothetical protein [Pseudomonas syringae]MCF5075287.1 hypothetical protein [Pseudomonas syringae]MCF5117081.1 hypothetical protein [Pseudomonas syringae]MCF5377438.1 hypothetical protein [Pseudomonas syringae]